MNKMVRRQTSPQRLVRRAKIILKAARGETNTEIGKGVGMTRNKVAHWRGVWLRERERLKAAEEAGIKEKELERKIERVLNDEARREHQRLSQPKR